MLDDRKENVENVKKIGAKLSTDDLQGRKVADQLEQLGKRWDALNASALERRNSLDDMLSVAKQFQDKLEPVMNWLDVTEKRVGAPEEIPVSSDKIKKHLENQEVCCAVLCFVNVDRCLIGQFSKGLKRFVRIKVKLKSKQTNLAKRNVLILFQ